MYRFDAEVGRNVDRFESSGFTIAGILQVRRGAVLNCAFLSAGGTIGRHQAASPQLMLVVNGEGWVKADDTDRIPIRAGQAAFWKQDEWHESGSEAGMTAIILEGPKLDPAAFMPPL